MDLSVITSLLPSSPVVPIIHWRVLLRVIAILYVPYLFATRYIRLNIIVASVGTVVLTWRANWAVTIRTSLWRSSWVRLGLRKLWRLLSGQPEAGLLSQVSIARFDYPGHSVRFLITIQENQRWWVGLDWTSALLPGERPAWCSTSLEALQPPSNFTLPEPTCIFTGDGKGGIVKHTASWAWEEEEWKVLVKKEVGTRRVEKELPVLKEDPSAHANRLGRAKQKVYEATAKLKKTQETDTGDVEGMPLSATSSADSEGHHDEDVSSPRDEDESYTDNDGWVYGDNKWKATSSSGGLGKVSIHTLREIVYVSLTTVKYTRFRKWTRIAILKETVEPASAAEALDYTMKQQESFHAPAESTVQADVASPRNSVDSVDRRSLDEKDDESSIRKRLKAAIRKSTTIS